MSGEGKVVCVTGASGYVASWIVKLLLQRGYTVKATVRNPNDPKKVEHLLSLEGAKERLHLLAANLLEEGSFDAAVEGCEGVFHTASPFFLHDAKDPEAELLDPAVKGTLNVLNSCAKFSSIKRVVLTSSTAAVACNGKPLSAEVVVDESWFSNADFCRKINAWYILSKTMAEEAAWNFVKEKGIDMVTINPGMIIGPLLQPTLNTSAATIAGLFGSEICPNMTFPWVHVKDVATAHILALEVPSANGRYCVSEIVTSLSEIVKVLREIYPDAALPEKCAEDENPLSASYQMSNKKAQSLGIDFIPFKTSLKETVESLKEKGFVKI